MPEFTLLVEDIRDRTKKDGTFQDTAIKVYDRFSSFTLTVFDTTCSDSKRKTGPGNRKSQENWKNAGKEISPHDSFSKVGACDHHRQHHQ